MVWIGALIVVLTFAAIIKKIETRLCLLVGGFTMAIIAGKTMVAGKAFVAAMTNPLVVTICSIMGFAYCMKATKCDEHMVKSLTGGLKKFPILLIPGAVVVTWIINIPLTSAAGCSAAVGSILIPALIGSGVRPEMAAATVFAGTWGSVISPGNSHNVFVSEMATKAKLPNSSVMDIIATHFHASVIALIIVVIGITAVSFLLKENKGYVADVKAEDDADFKVNPLSAIMPILPLVFLILASKQIGWLPADFGNIPLVMLLGTAIATVVTRVNPQSIIKSFWTGIGEAYGSVMGLIICASVFVAGMTAIGLTGELINFMKTSQSIAKIAGAFGSYAIAIVAGSGDAATLAFNGAITPHAAEFGLGMAQLGSISNVAGALGRSCSPVAAGAIVCAGIAGVSPMEISKRNIIPMFLAVCAVIFLL